MTRVTVLTVMLALMALAVAACGGTAPTPATAPTRIPTATPLPTPIPTPTLTQRQSPEAFSDAEWQQYVQTRFQTKEWQQIREDMGEVWWQHYLDDVRILWEIGLEPGF